MVGYPPFDSTAPEKIKNDKLKKEILYPNTISSQSIELIKMLVKINPGERITNISALANYAKEYFQVDYDVIKTNRFHYILNEDFDEKEPLQLKYYERRAAIADFESEFPQDDYSPQILDGGIQLSYHTVDLSDKKYNSRVKNEKNEPDWVEKNKIRVLDEYVYFKQEEHFEFENKLRVDEIMLNSMDNNLEKYQTVIKSDFKEKKIEPSKRMGQLEREIQERYESNASVYDKWRFREDEVTGRKVPRQRIFM